MWSLIQDDSTSLSINFQHPSKINTLLEPLMGCFQRLHCHMYVFMSNTAMWYAPLFAKIFTAAPNLKETFNLVCAEISYSTQSRFNRNWTCFKSVHLSTLAHFLSIASFNCPNSPFEM